MVARVATRIIVSQSNAAREPANGGYLLRRTPQAIAQLAALRTLPPDEIGRRLRAACGMQPAGGAAETVEEAAVEEEVVEEVQ